MRLPPWAGPQWGSFVEHPALRGGVPMTLALLRAEFEGAPLTVYTFRDRPCMVVADVGRALGYGDRKLGGTMRQNWSDELMSGIDFDTLDGDSLVAFKASLVDAHETWASKIHRSLTVLYESGLNLVCLKTEKPLGRKLRRFLAAEVMPKLARHELIAAVPSTKPPPWAAQILARLAALESNRDDPGGSFDGQLGATRADVVRRQLMTYGQLIANGNHQAAKSWRTSGDNELRSTLKYQGAGRTWARLPVARYGEAMTKLDVAHVASLQLPLRATVITRVRTRLADEELGVPRRRAAPLRRKAT